MGRTIVEKVFGARVGREVAAGELVVVPVDFVMSQDPKSPSALQVMREAELSVRIDPGRIALVIDHRVPCTTEQHANQHRAIRDFAEKHGIRLYDVGSGVGHVLLVEQGHVAPGQLVVATDAHATTCGAANVVGTSVGTTEMAALLSTGKLWFRVPQSLRVELLGTLPRGVYSKDVILELVGQIGQSGANYQSVEYVGEALRDMSMDARFTICSMTADTGAVAAVMEVDQVTRDWLARRPVPPWQPVSADPDASYSRRLELDLSILEPMVAAPHSVDNVVPVAQVVGTRLHQASIGTCTNGYLEDLRVAASIVGGRKVARGVRFFVVPASRSIYRDALREGIIDTLFEAGAVVLQPSCATCSMVDRQGVPGDGEVVISASNRNSRGRLGNKNASVYLASPATVAASAVVGAIADPRGFV